jgi:drug/metabolite transporter (DMT)-like permease
MTPLSALLLTLSVILSSGRNIISKKNAVTVSEKVDFYFSQTLLFLSALVVIVLSNITSLKITSYLTVVYGLIYGVLLIGAQWMLSSSLKTGNASVCSVVYSLGFIFPTVSGTIFWGETFTLLNGIGLILAVAVIFLSANKDSADNENQGNKFILFLLIAMLSSGGLGIMQKVQQLSPVASERGGFLTIAFALATIISFDFYLKQNTRPHLTIKDGCFTISIGVCFGGANALNTMLAGLVKSSILFPVLNVATILLCLVLSLILFEEKLTLKKSAVIILSVITVLVFSF